MHLHNVNNEFAQQKVKRVEISFDWIWDFTLYDFWMFLSTLVLTIRFLWYILFLYFVYIYDVINRIDVIEQNIEWCGI